MTNRFSRRDFIGMAAASGTGLALTLLKLPDFEQVFAAALKEIPVIWIQGAGDNGCSVSLLNTVSPTIQDLLLSEVVAGDHINLAFHPTVMAAQGDLAMKAMNDTYDAGPFALVIEGAVATKDNGIYNTVGEANGKGITTLETVKKLAPKAIACVAIGDCAAFGGISATPPNPSGSMGVAEFFKQNNITTPVINIGGCPPHPDWFIGSLAAVLIGGPASVKVDEHLRPLAFFGKLIHDQCPRRGQFEAKQFAKWYGDPGCLYQLGCKGPVTHADCSDRLWNGKTRWCVEGGAGCAGCAEPNFPWGLSPLRSPVSFFTATNGVAIGLAAVTAVGATAAVLATRSKKHSSDSNKDKR